MNLEVSIIHKVHKFHKRNNYKESNMTLYVLCYFLKKENERKAKPRLFSMH